MSTFSEQVKNVVRAIPAGQTMSYGAVAAAAGNPKAARAVARIMAQNFDARIPCHRVIKADGSLGGYNRGGSVAKAARLRTEGAIL